MTVFRKAIAVPERLKCLAKPRPQAITNLPHQSRIPQIDAAPPHTIVQSPRPPRSTKTAPHQASPLCPPLTAHTPHPDANDNGRSASSRLPARPCARQLTQRGQSQSSLQAYPPHWRSAAPSPPPPPCRTTGRRPQHLAFPLRGRGLRRWICLIS